MTRQLLRLSLLFVKGEEKERYNEYVPTFEIYIYSHL